MKRSNIIWDIIGIEFRKMYRKLYREVVEDDFALGFNTALEMIFGEQNLLSDKEPEEILYCKREKVLNYIKSVPKNTSEYGIRKGILSNMLGDRVDSDEEIELYKEKFAKEFESVSGAKLNPIVFNYLERP